MKLNPKVINIFRLPSDCDRGSNSLHSKRRRLVLHTGHPSPRLVLVSVVS